MLFSLTVLAVPYMMLACVLDFGYLLLPEMQSSHAFLLQFCRVQFGTKLGSFFRGLCAQTLHTVLFPQLSILRPVQSVLRAVDALSKCRPHVLKISCRPHVVFFKHSSPPAAALQWALSWLAYPVHDESSNKSSHCL